MVSNNICGGRALGIAVGITALAILLLAGSASALSNSGGGSWSYNKDIIITNTGNALAEYQVLVNLNGNNFPANARPDGADIRFTDAGGNELSYWVEDWDYANRTAKVWVNVTSIPVGANTIRMYYGNPMAVSVSNGISTFVFFDDFEDSNFREWTIDPAATMISSSEQHYTGTRSLKYSVNLGASPMSYHSIPQGKYEIVAYIYDPGYGTFSTPCQYMVFALTAHPYLIAGIDNSYCSSEKNYYAYFDDGNNRETWGLRSHAWHKLQWVSDGSTVKMYIDDSLIYTSAQSYLDTVGFYMYYWSGNGVGYGYFDDIRVRKYASPEPSVSVSAEVPDVAENFTIAHITDVHIGHYFLKFEMKNSVGKFTDTLQAIKYINPDRILITGDLVEYDNGDFFIAFKNLLRSVNIPVNTTPGNHDRRDGNLEGDNLTNYSNIINPINNPSNPNDNNFSFDYKGYRFIGLDSGADYHKDPTSPEATGLSYDQIRRLRGEFNNSAPKIIFMHHPVMSSGDDLSATILGYTFLGVPPDGAPGGNNGAIALNRWNFTNYTRDSNVQLVLTGHSHENAIFDISGNAPVANSSSNRPLFIQTQNKGYRIIEIKNGRANPYNSEAPPRYIRDSGELKSWKPNNQSEVESMLGLHAHDFSGEHTGMVAGCNDFELGIRDSYYTGDYGGSFTPQVIAGYSPIKDFKVYSCIRPSAVNPMINAKSLATIQNVPSLEPVFFNLTLEKQREISTTEINFNSINVTESSIATVNVSEPITSYKMEIDLNGDGTTDKTINPDSIDTILAQPQNNIDVITYNGAGTINLITGSGNFIKASSLNPLLLTGKPPYEFPYGIFGFNISGLNRGQTVEITITLPRNISSAAQYWKYGSTPDTLLPHWYQITLGSNDGDNVITIQLQDGGVGDDDLTANGIILDAGGPAISIAGKVTGEGWITSPVTPARKNNNKATFEFVARYDNGAPRGRIEFTDHAADVKIHGTVTTLSVDKEANTAAFSGLAEINGAKYAYTVTAVDNGKHGKTDTFSINIPAINYMSSGIVGGGNIQIHKDKIEDKDEVEDVDERD